ncbi:hypothetical protein C0581_01490 [Candidatus Parcubacteria bacterium]|nr:MAG: hypothetical protein C0581_01490 [Candidatus Parcubacteria bacterium]
MQDLKQPPTQQPPQTPGSQAPMDPIAKSKFRSGFVWFVVLGIVFYFGVEFLIKNEHLIDNFLDGELDRVAPVENTDSLLEDEIENLDSAIESLNLPVGTVEHVRYNSDLASITGLCTQRWDDIDFILAGVANTESHIRTNVLNWYLTVYEYQNPGETPHISQYELGIVASRILYTAVVDGIFEISALEYYEDVDETRQVWYNIVVQENDSITVIKKAQTEPLDNDTIFDLIYEMTYDSNCVRI